MTPREHFDEWQTLAAFRPRNFSDTALYLTTRRRVQTTGHAEHFGGRKYVILLRVGYDWADARATLLHEMAHVAAGWRHGLHHSRRWRERFLAAAWEVTGRIPPLAIRSGTMFDVHDWVRWAVKAQRQVRA